MNLDGETNTDEYLVKAVQIFDYCGAESTGTLRVDALMDKFAPFVKTNKAEYSYLQSLLDPDQSNPEITVTTLAMTLNKYSESQNIKLDLEESFNLKSGQAPHDSDSGISTDGFQLLEELQCELREKSHLVHQLRGQLDFTDRQHEEAHAALSAERDLLCAHLNMLREENMTLTHVRRDYEEVCERVCGAERALADARRDLDAARRRARVHSEQIALLEAEKLTLQELLTKSKDECHRINEMYASRQAALLEENETLRGEHADLAARLQDQDEFMQQLIKEKVLLEMELKDLLNKSNQTQLRMDRSIDVSYTEDQMLTALDSLNADSRFAQEHRLLDEESFVNALREEQGRATNMSLFDEIRLSFCNMSRHNITESMPDDKEIDQLDTSLITVAIQTESSESESNDLSDKVESNVTACENCQHINKSVNTVATQTDNTINIIEPTVNSPRFDISMKSEETQTDCYKSDKICINVQTNTQEDLLNNNSLDTCVDCSKCNECEKLKQYNLKLETDMRHSREAVCNMQMELDKYEDNLTVLKEFVDQGNDKNKYLQEVVVSLQSKLVVLESACEAQGGEIEKLFCETCSAVVQTDSEQSSVSTQTELPCTECVKRKVRAPSRTLKRFLWEPLKVLFQLFAVVCFACAVCALYGVSRRGAACRERAALPWRWLDARDLMDLLLSIEYVADVPM